LIDYFSIVSAVITLIHRSRRLDPKKNHVPFLSRVSSAGRILLVAAATVISCEVMLRVFFQIPWDTAALINDKKVGFRVRPGAAFGGPAANSRGYNDREITNRKRGRLRIGVIGDSFVYGTVSRQQNFVTILDSLCNAFDPGIEVINLGTPGFGPWNYAAVAASDAVSLQVDLAIVVLFAGNDIRESHPDFTGRITTGSFHFVLKKPWLVGPSLEYSMVFSTLRAVVRRLSTIFSRKETTLSERSYLSIERQRLDVCRVPPPPFYRKADQGFIQALDAIEDSAARAKMRVVFVIAPDEFQVNANLREKMEHQFHLQWDRFDLKLPQEIAVRHLGGGNGRALDLLPVFNNLPLRDSLYTPFDSHWNALGNRCAAEAIGTFLKAGFYLDAGAKRETARKSAQ
jgi:hypothetical protein